MNTVYTGGTFDMLHYGHLHFLNQAASIGRLIVCLNTDDFVERFKNKRPLQSLDERRKTLEELPMVDSTMVNEWGEDSTHTILASGANIIAVGSDWARKDYYKQMGFTQDWLDENGISLIYIPYTQGISSTELRHRLSDVR